MLPIQNWVSFYPPTSALEMLLVGYSPREMPQKGEEDSLKLSPLDSCP
jgi:hypothetical protein